MSFETCKIPCRKHVMEIGLRLLLLWRSDNILRTHKESSGVHMTELNISMVVSKTWHNKIPSSLSRSKRDSSGSPPSRDLPTSNCVPLQAFGPHQAVTLLCRLSRALGSLALARLCHWPSSCLRPTAPPPPPLHRFACHTGGLACQAERAPYYRQAVCHAARLDSVSPSRPILPLMASSLPPRATTLCLSPLAS